MGNNPLGGLGGLLGNLFGGQQPHRMEDYQDFNDRYDRYNDPNDPTDDTHFDDRDVQDRYRRMLRNAPPDVLDQAHEDAFRRLSPQQREQMAYEMFRMQQQQGGGGMPQVDPRRLAQDPRQFGRYMRRAEQQNPGILDQLFGGQAGPMNNPLLKMALAGAAAMAARRFLSGGGLGGQMGGLGGLGGNPLGGLGGGNPLGGLLGGIGGNPLGIGDQTPRGGGGGSSSPLGGTDV